MLEEGKREKVYLEEISSSSDDKFLSSLYLSALLCKYAASLDTNRVSKR